MRESKKTTKVESAVKSAAEKAKPAVKAAAEKAKPVVKAAKEKAAPVVKAAEKKAKEVVSRKADKTETITLQFAGKSYTTEDLVKIAKDVWKYDLGKEEGEFKSVELYVKPEESMVYYIINEDVLGNFKI